MRTSAARGLSPLAQQRSKVGQRSKVSQLVGVDDRADGLDLAVGDVEDDHSRQPALSVEQQRTRLAVDLGAAHGQAEAGSGAQPRVERPSHPRAAGADGGTLPARRPQPRSRSRASGRRWQTPVGEARRTRHSWFSRVPGRSLGASSDTGAASRARVWPWRSTSRASRSSSALPSHRPRAAPASGGCA
jgi:hypothetical protein